MKFSEILNITLLNLAENKFKVLLTSLGIIVGTVTIIMVIAIGKGGDAEVKKQFEGLSAGSIYINLNYSNKNLDLNKVPHLDEEKMGIIKDDSKNIEDVAINISGSSMVKILGKDSVEPVVGISENFSDINNFKIQAGENINIEHQNEYQKVAILGSSLAEKHFGNVESAVGKKIKIRGKNYAVIGVLERKGDGMQGISPDQSIFVPYSTAIKNIYKEKGNIPQGVALVDDIDKVKDGMDDVESALYYIFGDESDNYIVEDAGSKIEAATASSKTMNILLMSVATIVFIVGGIGIMNVLTVTVKERTKEIGILKALGSSKKDILIQFLLEAVLMSSFGGICGILLSYILAPLTTYLGVPVLFTIDGKIIALLFAVVTGTIFGFYPAYKASNLKPVEALSYE